MAYDYLLTFEREMEYIWAGKRSLSVYLCAPSKPRSHTDFHLTSVLSVSRGTSFYLMRQFLSSPLWYARTGTYPCSSL